MASPRVGNTAVGAAVCRLIEQYQPPAARLFTDPVIGAMLSAPVPFLMRFKAMRAFTVKQTEGVLPGLYGEQVCRTRAIDEALLAALAAPSGPRQVVILGAGFDTRAYRLAPLASRPVFEVDLPSVQQDKQKKVHKFLGRAPEHVTFVPIDFDTHPRAGAGRHAL